ncbi:hypothetical protein LTR85_011239 [Meristemomyces frigidus]|nr:hypothetical protein LTR85_011239 [Meristemomyces frigidus]
MGVDSRRPPLPAPTESMDETSGVETEVATNVTRATDKTSYEVPEDGSPITISTQKVTGGREGGRPGHHRQKSQTSLLIEYFEASKTGDKVRSRPSVRVKVTPSAAKKSRNGGHDAVQITGIGKDRKPSYTRRISLGSSKNVETSLAPTEGTEISHSSESNLSGRPPVEIEVLNHNGSDMSNGKSSRGLMYANNESNVSSMPPDSMIEGSNFTESELSRDTGYDDDVTVTDKDHLTAPIRSRSRSASRERITQKVMEKLGRDGTKPRKSSRSGHERSISKEYDAEGYPLKERRRRSSKTQYPDDETVSGAESSLLSSQLAPSQRSYRSGTSQGSRMTNNPKLLEMVEDTIKRMILPEINAIKEDQKTDRNIRSFESTGRGSLPRDGYESPGELQRRVSKSSSTPNISSKPKVVLNRDGDDPGTVLSRGDSERKKVRKSSRESYTEERPSSRRSSGRHSSKHGEDYDDDEQSVRHKSSKSGHGLRNAAAAGMAGGILTGAALKHHDSKDNVHERRKKRTKSHGSRSRSASLAETNEDSYTHTRKEDIPPMPLASHINDSDITRDSIVSAATERPSSRASADVRTPVREVSRGSVSDAMSPVSSRTPTRTPVPVSKRGLGMSHTNQSISGPNSPISTKARMAALAAAGLGGIGAGKAYEEHEHERGMVDADGYGDEQHTQRSVASPVQSVSSLKKQFEDDDSPLIPQGLRPQSAASRSSAGRLRNEQRASESSLRSMCSSPTTQRLAQSRQHSGNVSGGDDFVTPLERPNAGFMRDEHSTPGTPTGESVDEWWQRQHHVNDQYRDSDQLNDRYRDSLDETTNRDSYQTNPFPEDEKRFTQFTDDSYAAPVQDSKRFTQYTDDSFGAGVESTTGLDTEHDVKGVAAKPNYHAPLGVQSDVASLMDPSTISSNMLSGSSDASSLPAKQNGTYADRMSEHLRDMGKDSPAVYEGSTVSQTMPSQDRWAAIKGHARNISSAASKDDINSVDSPRQSPAKSLREVHSREERERVPQMGASGLPVADDPLPEIGHFDDTRSEISTNPSVIKGPLGGDATGKDTWPYTPEPDRQQRDLRSNGSRSLGSGHSRDGGLMAAAAGGAAALAAAHAGKQPSFRDEEEEEGRNLTPDMRQRGEEIDRDATPTSHAAAYPDEGYVTDAHARSAGALTPRAEHQRYGKDDVEDYNRAMDAHSLGEDDPFTSKGAKHSRHLSGNSHGMASPLYDGATGKGLDRIQSHDIVALMDHLTVRDAQRNARDTEILVTLVRSAAEMRQSFDEMKRFIAEQDKLIMRNTDRDAEETVHKVQNVLSGPRPQPLGSPRTPRRDSQEDIQAKRKGVLRRALKGLTGGKKADDLARVEDMLMQILDNVEDLKHGGAASARQPMSSYTTDTLDSYEKLRAAPDSGYEPEGQAGTSSTPSHSGHLSLTPRATDKQQFHSGYDGRRGSVNRVSTVLEGDEDDLTPDEHYLLSHQADNNERLLTPTQEVQRKRGLSPSNTPPHHAATFGGVQANDLTPKAAEKQRKHRSNGSSIFGVPKTSRWSKTTTSSAAPDLAANDSPGIARDVRPLSSRASQSSSQLDDYDNERYAERRGDDPLGSSRSLASEQDRPVSQAETRSMRSQGSRITRTPSPLIPSEASLKHGDEYDDEGRGTSPIQQDLDHEFDDPKYQAHRNSLLLQHPQPRQGATARHQSQLETQAHLQNYPGDVSGNSATSSDLSQRTVSDFDPTMWGSSGTAALARNRFSVAEQPISPASGRDEGPLVPQPQKQKGPAVPPKIYEPEPEPDWEREPQYSNSGFSKGGYYSSPYGSGHLLEPIEEVRYSLETDRGVSPDAQVSSAKAVDMRSNVRKITGPRPMGSRSPGPQPRIVENNGTVRRKPVARSQASLKSEDSLQSDGY